LAQRGQGRSAPAELDVLAGEGDRRNVSALGADAQALERPGGSEPARGSVAVIAPVPLDETRVCGVAPLARARRQLVNGRVVCSLPGEDFCELVVGRWIDRVDRQLLLELRGRVRRTTRAREDPGQLVPEMARQRVQLHGNAHLRLGLLEASERPQIDTEEV